MYLSYCIIHSVTLVALIILFCGCFRFTNSRAKSAYMTLVFSMAVIVLGFFLELTMSECVSSALVALKVQYFGLSVMLFELMDFCSVIGHYKVSKFTYALLAADCLSCYIAIFTTWTSPGKNHGLFYSRMRIVSEGAYNRIKITPGPFWYLFYITIAVVFLYAAVRLTIQFFKSNPIQRKRIGYLLAGILTIGLELALKGLGAFGSYNFFTIALLIMITFMYFSIFRYGYFNSVSSAAENAFNYGGEGIVLIDENGRLTFINNSMKQIMPELLQMKYASEHSTIYDILTGKISSVRIAGVTYEAKVEEIKEYDAHCGYMIWLVNVTEYSEMLAQLDAANAAKSSFLARVSHEIRTPINTILGMNEMIRRECHDEEIQKYSGSISSAGETLLVLINDILDISKVESGKLSIITSDYDVISLLNDVWIMIYRRTEEKGIKLSFDVSRDMPKSLHGDKVRIKQMLINLLTNSIKYTDDGFVRLKAWTEPRGESVDLIVSVSDTGVGIKEENIGRIFDSFERIESTIEGTGLGLAITKQLAEAMDGKLEVESIYGCGSKFTMTIPQRVVDASPAEPFEPKEAPTVKNSDAPFFVAPNAKILITDDNRMNRVVIEKLLKRTKAMVETAESGAQALEKVTRTKYDVILLDAMMPNMDGTETLRRMRSLENNLSADVPIIVITANAVTGARDKYIADGFTDYISKPVKPLELERIIGKYINSEAVSEEPPLDCQKGMHYCENDSDFYNEMLELFTKESVQLLGEMEKSLSDNDCACFRAQVHGLKNNCRSIGADKAADFAYEMEQTAEREDVQELSQQLRALTEQIDEINDYICKITFEKEKTTIK